ncbi:MAG: acetylglutamate kinase [Bacillota bacterium]
MLSALEKANVLTEALPYIQKFAGKTIVIKYGGHAMVNPELEELVLKDIILMKLVGMNPVIVHGGGPIIDKWLEKVDIKARFVNGLRITDEATMEVVEMVLVGKVNKGIVNLINRFGGKAVGLCGKDGNLVIAEKKQVIVKNQAGEETFQDLGLVGEVVKVNPEIIQKLTEEGYIPVVSPVGVSSGGETLNINADYVAGALGGALKAHKLVLLTDVEGIYLGEGRESLASRLTASEIPRLIQEGVIKGGMIPKVESCLAALEKGVENVHIVDGRKPHSMLLEIFTNEGIGTMVVKG